VGARGATTTVGVNGMEKTRMRLAREPGAGSGERGAGKKRAGSGERGVGKKRAGSRDCCKKSRNR
jgi:hypothetical protein